MKKTTKHATVLALAALAFALPAEAHHGKGSHGRGHGHGPWKQEFHAGNCKIERKWTPGGVFKEEIKCDGPIGGYMAPPVIVVQQPVVQPVALPPLPSGPNYGVVYRDTRGRYCREYQTTGLIGGVWEKLYGTVCLQADGTWAFNDG